MTTSTETRSPAGVGRAALVTGAGSGIGRAIAQALADEGWRVACADRDGSNAQATAEQLGGASFSIEADITSADDCERMADDTAGRFGQLDGFVGAAGVHVSQRVPADELPLAEWSRVIGTNLTGTFLSATAAARMMRRDNVSGSIGAMVLIGSIAARAVPVPGIAPYIASKAGLEGLARALAVDWAPHGIRVNAVSPGIVYTAMTEASLSDEAVRNRHEARIPAGRIADAGDIAGAVVFLLSAPARYVTGASLPVDGGWSIS